MVNSRDWKEIHPSVFKELNTGEKKENHHGDYYRGLGGLDKHPKTPDFTAP